MKSRRVYFLCFSFFFWAVLIWLRLFYWQVIEGDQLAAVEKKQSLTIKKGQAPRGEIYAADHLPLVLNQPQYSLYLWQPSLAISKEKLVNSLLSVLVFADDEEKQTWKERVEQDLKEEENWILLKKAISKEEKEEIEALAIEGLGLEEQWRRFYPEASASAHILGFLGRDSSGKEKGYFGLEGYYDRQLQGKSQLIMEGRGWWGKLSQALQLDASQLKGRDLLLHLDRAAQFIVEEELKKGIEAYGAESGWAVVLHPQTGGVLAMAAFPSYDPARYSQFGPAVFPNPIVAHHFEPGSIFKPIVLAAALEEKAVSLKDKCDICTGPVTVYDYQIETWNDQYFPESNVSEIIQHSDNVGMVWLGRKLGLDNLLKYLEKFNFGRKTKIDSEEEDFIPVREEKNWYPIDLAVASFGQGIAVTPIQMAAAFNALANDGVWLQPRLVKAIIDRGEAVELSLVSRPVVSQETADQVKEILVNAVEKGEAQWTKIAGYRVAGKTGTAQIPIKGRYQEEETIASFIGFAPADKPQFTMLVSLNKPKTSPWGSETAAPVWFKIAKRLFYLYGIAPGGE